ncbi:MAG: CPBP family intramembrane metalloprotease [Clostridia bacterium]|nr:CPBP family intramembrane metalloprotease [Clostridia bacterium]
MDEPRKDPAPLVRLILAHLALLILLLLAGFLYARTGFGGGLWEETAIRVVFSAAMIFCLYTISGTEHLKWKKGAVKTALKMCAALLIFAGAVTCLSLTAPDRGKPASVTDGLLPGTLFCLTVGIFEETAYRAVIYDGIGGFLNHGRKTYTVSAIVTFFVFGVSHVLNELTDPAMYADPALLLQMALKIVQTGIIGLIMMLIYARTGTVWAPAAAHALYDLLLSLPQLLTEAGVSMEYVSTENAAEGINSYILMSLIELWVYLALRRKYLPEIRTRLLTGEK